MLNVKCIDLLARDLAEELRVAVSTTDWLALPKPRSVSPYVDAVIRYAASLLATFTSLFNDGPSAGSASKPLWIPSGALPAPKQYTSRLKQAQLSASMIQSDIDRMFSRKVRALCSPTHARTYTHARMYADRRHACAKPAWHAHVREVLSVARCRQPSFQR